MMWFKKSIVQFGKKSLIQISVSIPKFRCCWINHRIFGKTRQIPHHHRITATGSRGATKKKNSFPLNPGWLKRDPYYRWFMKIILIYNLGRISSPTNPPKNHQVFFVRWKFSDLFGFDLTLHLTSTWDRSKRWLFEGSTLPPFSLGNSIWDFSKKNI